MIRWSLLLLWLTPGKGAASKRRPRQGGAGLRRKPHLIGADPSSDSAAKALRRKAPPGKVGGASQRMKCIRMISPKIMAWGH